MRRPHWRVADLRLILVGVLLVAAWMGIGYRLFRVQGADAATLAQRGFDQRVRHEAIEPRRGTIFDRDGVELAISVEASALAAVVPAARRAASKLSLASSSRPSSICRLPASSQAMAPADVFACSRPSSA